MVEPKMLFEEDLFFNDWLDWFFEEVPFIQDKNLQFTGSLTGKKYLITELNGLVKTDKENKNILVIQGEPVVITLNSLNLYELLCTY